MVNEDGEEVSFLKSFSASWESKAVPLIGGIADCLEMRYSYFHFCVRSIRENSVDRDPIFNIYTCLFYG